MAEYIEREALLKEVASRIVWTLSYHAIYEAIQEAPAADVVEVVRCKDCKYWDDRGYCDHEHWEDAEGWAKTADHDDFCSYGRRNDADNRR